MLCNLGRRAAASTAASILVDGGAIQKAISSAVKSMGEILYNPWKIEQSRLSRRGRRAVSGANASPIGRSKQLIARRVRVELATNPERPTRQGPDTVATSTLTRAPLAPRPLPEGGPQHT